MPETDPNSTVPVSTRGVVEDWELAEPSEPDAIGDSVGRYVVLGEVGRGGMGRVVRAYDPKLEREVALKEVRPDRAGHEPTESARLRIVTEARAMAKLSHPNVVSVYDVVELDGASEDRVLLVMEYVAGTTLKGWLVQGPHPLPLVVQRYVAAGRGLAAAHAAGLLHRDFKPANVLLSRDGEVKVTDFGLAKYHGPSPSEELEGVSGFMPVADHADAESATRPGTVMGTPRYMAPEQYTGSSLSVAVDQYAFCVALWEAIAREPPFHGDEMFASKLAGPPPWPDVPAPRTLVDALRRGLAADERDRWPSIDALLAELEHDPNRRRTVVVLGSLGIGALGVGGVGLQAWDEARAERCTGAPAELADAWNPERRESIRSVLAQAGGSYAASVAERVTERVDAWSDEWMAEHRDACEATAIRGEQSPEVMDLRMACLYRARQDLDATAVVLADADADVLRNADRLVHSLQPATACADIEALTADVGTPPEAHKAGVARLRALLAASKAERLAGRWPEAREYLDNADMAFAEVDYPPVQSELELERGLVANRMGEWEAADEALRTALASALRDDRRAIARDTAVELMFTHAEGTQDAEAGMRYREIAEGLAGDDIAAQARVLNNAGVLHSLKIEYAEAAATYERAIELYERAPGDWSSQIIDTRLNRAVALENQGLFAEAEAEGRNAIAVQEATLGPQHPDVAGAYNNLANTMMGQNRPAEAEQAFRRSVEVYESVSALHPNLALALNGLGGAVRAQGRHDEAEMLFRRALSIYEQAVGPEDPRVADALNNIAAVLAAKEQFEEGLELHERALALREKTLGPDHPMVGMSLNNIASLLEATGKHDEAVEPYRRALKIWRASLGDDHPYVRFVQANLAGALATLEQWDEALVLAEKAWERHQHEDTPDEMQGLNAFTLARALWAKRQTPRDEARALSLAQQAIDALRGSGLERPGQIEELQEWIAERR